MWGKSPAVPLMQGSSTEAAVKPGMQEPAIRHFTGTAMRLILADVRAAFGPDAIILKQESNNGRIRITACSERQLSQMVSVEETSGRGLPATGLDTALFPVNASSRGISRSVISDNGDFGIVPVRETAARSSAQVQDSAPLPRGRIAGVELPVEETAGRSWWGRARTNSRQGPSGSTSADAQLLTDLDYSESVVAQLVDASDAAGIAERIAGQLVEPRGPITADPDTGTLLPGAYRFSGPSGHGKTSLISRLVTAFVLAHGTEGVVLLSTDQDRLGGTLKLARLAQLLGVDFHVSEEADLPLWCRQGHRLLLIDTDGEPSTARRTRGSPVDVLVLSAVAQNRLLARALDGASPDCVIALTQLDQAETLGSAFSVLLADEHLRRPIEWLGFGQNIEDSHCHANLANVSQWALRGVDRSGKRTNFS